MTVSNLGHERIEYPVTTVPICDRVLHLSLPHTIANGAALEQRDRARKKDEKNVVTTVDRKRQSDCDPFSNLLGDCDGRRRSYDRNNTDIRIFT